MTDIKDSLWYWRAKLDRNRTFYSPIVDGDTWDLTIDTGFFQQMRIRVRGKGIDTEEIFGEAPNHHLGMEQKQFVIDWTQEGMDQYDGKWPFVVKTEMATGKYGRWVGDIWRLSDETSLIDAITEEWPEVAEQ